MVPDRINSSGESGGNPPLAVCIRTDDLKQTKKRGCNDALNNGERRRAAGN